MKMKDKPQEKQYIIYSRKSKFTGKGESIENQIELCRQYIAMHFGEEAAENVLVYEDEGFSGGNLERPQFKKMMKDSQKIEFAAIVVYRLDRISRNIGDFAKLIEDLGDRHIDFISIREQFDTSSPMGRAMMYIASVFSQLERETIAERIRDNMHELSKTGRWLGGTTPTGYASESLSSVTVDGKVKKACKLKPIPEEIQLVKTGQVTYAVRDTVIDDKEIKQDDYMGIGDKGILSVGTDMEKTVLEMIGEMIDEDSAILSIYYGEEMNEDSANEIAEKVEEEYPDVEVEVHYGGQPIYYYVISVE